MTQGVKIDKSSRLLIATTITFKKPSLALYTLFFSVLRPFLSIVFGVLHQVNRGIDLQLQKKKSVTTEQFKV